ncbi:MAG: S1 family peptidase [Acidobacteriia bacterium]|nr:S1 family peptidase [Terriglobia bacterium]
MLKICGILLTCTLLIGAVGCGGGSSATPTPTPPLNPPTVSATSTTVPIGTTRLFTATNFSGAVTWSITPAVGTIDTNGLYHAPASFPSPNTFTVTATAGTQTASVGASVVFPNDNAGPQTIPVKLGTSGGNVNDIGATVCCIGTMGSLWTRADLVQPVILSNNHVLDRSSQGSAGEGVRQPGQSACFGSGTTIANLTQAAALAPAGTAQGRTGASPSNTDSAIAQIVPGTVDMAGTILDLGPSNSTSIAAAPPSSTLATATLGMAVSKSGRTTGLTCSTVSSINTSVQVAYETSCGSNVTAFNATYTGQVMINGGSFSAGGDSGSLVVTTATARPVALLYGGSTTDTVANPIQDVITALSSGVNTLTPVSGNPDHAVSCAPTATGGPQLNGTASATVPLSAPERQRVTAVHQRHAGALMQDAAVSSVMVGASADSPGEGALVIHLSRAANAPIPAVMDGVRTRVVYDDGSGIVQPSIGQVQIDHATAVKEAHVADLMSQPGIQGVGVAISGDNPAETAVSIYVVEGVSHPVIPPVIDGIRTKIFSGTRFKAF